MSIIPHHTSDPVCPLCEQKLLQADARLSAWFHDHVKPSFPEAHVSWTYRDQISQDQAVCDGKSKLSFPNSAHNKLPALAIDLFEIDQTGKATWNPSFFNAIHDMNQKLGIDLLWGAQFRTLGDSDHWEIPKQIPKT